MLKYSQTEGLVCKTILYLLMSVYLLFLCVFCRSLNTSGETQRNGTLCLLALLPEFQLLLEHQLVKKQIKTQQPNENLVQKGALL